jgi:hypothetical protein
MRFRILSAFLLAAALTFAQQKPEFAGDYAGILGPYHVKLHLTGSGSALAGTVDSPDQGMSGLQCTDVHVNGLSLSFNVPMVSGTWTGFLSADGNSLSGMWSQGTPMPLNLSRITAANAASAAPTVLPPRPGVGEVKWDDYIFKYNPSGTMAQVFAGGKVVGTILTMNGDQRVVPLPGPDAEKLTKSFEDYKAFAARSHAGGGSAATASATPSPATQPAIAPGTATTSATTPVTASETPASAIHFDDANHSITVPRPDGVTVTFVGNDVKIANFRRGSFVLRHQKGSAGRFLESNVEHSGRVGGSISGGGEEFLRDGGGIIYDSGMGGNNLQENPQVLLAKQLSQVAVDAVADVRRVPGHETFTPPGYNTLKDISQYRLRSDGSR